VLNPVFNTTGAPTALKISLTNTASAANAALLDITTVGLTGSRLLIPVNAARVAFYSDGLQIMGQSSGTGSITLNSTLPAQNQFVCSTGFLLRNATSLGNPNDNGLTLIAGGGTQINPPSGTTACILLRSDFQPTSGTAIGSIVTIDGTINQTGGANGLTRGLWINPTLGAVVNFRALDVTGGIFFSDAAAMLHSTVAMTNGAAAAVGTLLNAPTAGNPTKWIPIDDNGITRHIPSW
jgi:hypothetical protein